jgi:PAS domain S-box-containing protein
MRKSASNKGGKSARGQGRSNGVAPPAQTLGSEGQGTPFRAVIESITDGLIVLDREYRCTYANDAAAAFLRTTPDELIGQIIWDVIPPPRYHQLHEELTRAAEQKVFVRFEEYCETSGHWYEWRCYPTDAGLTVFFDDATEHKQVEDALRESEERYRKLFESNLAGVYITRLDGTILDFNDTMMKMLGYDSREEVFQHRSADFYADPEFRKELIYLLHRDGIVPGREALLQRKDGSPLYAIGAAVLLTNEQTGERYIQGVAVDITDRKEAEEQLAENLRDMEFLSVSATRYLEAMPSGDLFQYTAQQLHAIAGNAVIMVSEYNPGTNQTTLRAMAGPEDKLRKASVMLGRNPVGLAFTVAEGTRKRMVRGRLERVEGGLYDLTFYQIPLPLATRLEQELRVGEIYAMPFYLGEDFMGTVAVATDQSEGLMNRELMETIVNQAALALKRTRTEESLRGSEQALRDLTATLEAQVAQRTAELEHRAKQLQKLMLELSEAEDRERKRMAEILHDDLQQILAAAKFHLGLLETGTKGPQESRQIARGVKQMLSDAIEKSRSLSHELSPAVLYQSDLEDTFTWLARQMQSKYGLAVHVDIRGPVDLQSEALRALLYKATQELLFNVVKHARTNEATIRLRCLGRYLCLSVSDKGRGFDPEQLRQAAGFGLLSIQERVALLGGRMKIKSIKGKGSTFRIVVPAGQLPGTGAEVEQQPTDQAEAENQARGEGDGRLRVLLVDDHEIVRQGMALLLGEQSNIEVVGQASNGREAINLTFDLRPDVVVMDVSMPLMNGDEATRQIKRHVPGTRVVALSMYDEIETIERMYNAGAESYVLKTAPSEELVAAIRGTQSAG